MGAVSCRQCWRLLLLAAATAALVGLFVRDDIPQTVVAPSAKTMSTIKDSSSPPRSVATVFGVAPVQSTLSAAVLDAADATVVTTLSEEPSTSAPIAARHSDVTHAASNPVELTLPPIVTTNPAVSEVSAAIIDVVLVPPSGGTTNATDAHAEGSTSSPAFSGNISNGWPFFSTRVSQRLNRKQQKQYFAWLFDAVRRYNDRSTRKGVRPLTAPMNWVWAGGPFSAVSHNHANQTVNGTPVVSFPHRNASARQAVAPHPGLATHDVIAGKHSARLMALVESLRDGAALDDAATIHPVTAGTAPRTDNEELSLPAPRLEIMLCPRAWLAEFLVAAVNGTSIPPRFKMGEVRAWRPLLEALYASSCSVVISGRDCPHLDEFLLNSADDVSRLAVVEDIHLLPLRRLKREHCDVMQELVVATANQKSDFVNPARTLTPFSELEGIPIGVVASCPFALQTGNRSVTKEWFGLVWGKQKQVGSHVTPTLEQLSDLLPMVATCTAQCAGLAKASIANFNLVPKLVFDELLARALVMVGVKAPRSGASVAEAIACGTIVIARPHNVPVEFHDHPLVRLAPSRPGLVAHLEQVLREHGFDFSRRASEQLAPPITPQAAEQPSALAAAPSWLRSRYTANGHLEHIQRLFGINDECVVTNRDAPVLAMMRKQAWAPCSASVT
jgi:hypothetical protein